MLEPLQVDKIQVNAANKNGANRNQTKHVSSCCKSCVQDRTLVLAIKPVHSSQRRRIDVPGVPRNIPDALDGAVMRRVKPVVHCRGEPQRHIATVVVGIDEVPVAEEFGQRIGPALDLIEFGPGKSARARR